MTGRISVEVVYATPEEQTLLTVDLDEDATVELAIEESGIRQECPDMVLNPSAVGIFGRKVSLQQQLNDGDRVEIYRALLIDPMEARRLKAEKAASKAAKTD